MLCRSSGAPGHDETATRRREPDRVRVLCGIVSGRTCGAPVAAIIENTDARGESHAGLRDVPRPGHADYTTRIRYGNFHDVAGGGHFSGRLTAPLCIAGGIAIQILSTLDIDIVAHIGRIAECVDAPLDPLVLDRDQISAVRANRLPCIEHRAAETMRGLIRSARNDADSVGGVVECAAYGLPVGIGDPMFAGLENRIAGLAFGIPAVKGVEFGAGFALAELRGSQSNDAFRLRDGCVEVITNRAGGILGGISTGAPLVWRMAVEQTPSVGKSQESVDLASGKAREVDAGGDTTHASCRAPCRSPRRSQRSPSSTPCSKTARARFLAGRPAIDVRERYGSRRHPHPDRWHRLPNARAVPPPHGPRRGRRRSQTAERPADP